MFGKYLVPSFTLSLSLPLTSTSPRCPTPLELGLSSPGRRGCLWLRGPWAWLPARRCGAGPHRVAIAHARPGEAQVATAWAAVAEAVGVVALVAAPDGLGEHGSDLWVEPTGSVAAAHALTASGFDVVVVASINVFLVDDPFRAFEGCAVGTAREGLVAFMRAWSGRARGEDVSAGREDRWAPASTVEEEAPERWAPSEKPPEFLGVARKIRTEDCCVLPLPASTLAALKAAAGESSEPYASTDDVLTARVWRALVVCRLAQLGLPISKAGTTCCLRAANVRPVLDLPEDYAGNATTDVHHDTETNDVKLRHARTGASTVNTTCGIRLQSSCDMPKYIDITATGTAASLPINLERLDRVHHARRRLHAPW